MKPFIFQQFKIQQHSNVFRVGTDGVLLGALADVSNVNSAIEIGTGSGLISLMLAQRNSSVEILALDINPIAVELANENFSNSLFSKRLKAEFSDFKLFSSSSNYDLIISNPPFFEINSSGKDVLARQKLELDFIDIIEKSSQLLSRKGRLSVIIPKNDELNFVALAKQFQLNLQRKVEIKGIIFADIKRVVLEFGFDETKLLVENFVIEKEARVYSDQYLEATKDFHVFKTKTP